MSNKVMGGNTYRGDCPTCGHGLFGSMIHHCPKSPRAIELAKKRKEKLTNQILKTTKDFGIEKPLEGWDLILRKFKESDDDSIDIWNLDDFVDYLKQNYKTPTKL